MNAYTIGADILGTNANDSTAALCRTRPLSADKARKLIALCVRRLQGKGIGGSPTATQLVNIDESIVLSGKKVLPDSAADVLCGLAARSVGECEILGNDDIIGSSHDPRPYWARGINPYLEVSPIYDHPPDDEWLVPKAGGGYQKVILGADEVLGAGEMVPGGWWYTGSHRGPWWGGNGPFMEVDDFVDPMMNVDPTVLIGLIDIQSSQRRMNELKPVTLAVARALLSSGQEVIAKAVSVAKQPWYRSDLPGESARNKVYGKLQWHAAQLGAQHDDPNTVMYASGDDLKKWVMQAFIEQNASDAGAEAAAWLEIKWNAMWEKIAAALASIPRQVRAALISAASGTIEAVTGLPLWAWLTILIGGTAVVGFIAYKLFFAAANTKAGVAVVSRYLP